MPWLCSTTATSGGSAPGQDGHEVGHGLSGGVQKPPRHGLGWPRSGFGASQVPAQPRRPAMAQEGRRGAGAKGNAAAPSPAHQSQLPDPAHGEGKRNPGTSQPTETSTSPPPAGTCKSNSGQASSYFRASNTRHLTEHSSINHLALIFFSPAALPDFFQAEARTTDTSLLI